MTIKQQGGIFGRNPSFNDVSVETLSIAGTTLSSTAAELNILDGVTSSAAELNILDGVTATTAELNILDGVTANATELNYLDGASTSVVTASKAVLANASANIAFASGSGIDFSADGQAAGMTSELLDDYEEGTWTPAFASAAGTITSTTVNGATYTKVGRLVTLGFDVTITDNGTGSVAINVTGLPFALAAAYSSAGPLIEIAAVGFGGFVNPNSTTSLSLTKYDWTYPGGTNYRLVGSISYNV
jgi:hypothetical protein